MPINATDGNGEIKEVVGKIYIDSNGVAHDYTQIVQFDSNGNGHEIWGGVGRIYNLGAGRTIDIKDIYSRWNELTADNFFILNLTQINASDRIVVHTTGGDVGYLTLWMARDMSYSNGVISTNIRVNDNYSNPTIAMITDTSKLVNLGTSTSFNVSNVRGYQDFTIDNFLVKVNSLPQGYLYNGFRGSAGDWTVDGSYKIIKSYNAQTGVLTCYINDSAEDNIGGRYSTNNAVNVYLYPKRIRT